MEFFGRIVFEGRYPLEDINVQIVDAGDGRLTKRELVKSKNLRRTVTGRDGTFEVLLPDVADDRYVGVIVRTPNRQRVLEVYGPVLAGDIGKELVIEVPLGQDRPAQGEGDEPDAYDSDGDQTLHPNPEHAWKGRILGVITSGRIRRGATAQFRVDEGGEGHVAASSFVRKDGTFVLEVGIKDSVLGRVVLAGPQKEGQESEGVLYRHEVLKLSPGQTLSIGIELPRLNRPDRPERPNDPVEAGAQAGEQFARGAASITGFRDELVRKPFLQIQPKESAAVKEQLDRRDKILKGTPAERFTPSRRSPKYRFENPRFVDPTLSTDEREQGRYLAQLDAVRAGIDKLEPGGRGDLRLRFDPADLLKIPGAKERNGTFTVPAAELFAELADRFHVAPRRREVPKTLLERLNDCIESTEEQG